MTFFEKILAWFRGAEVELEADVHKAVDWVRPRFLAYAKIAEEIFGDAVEQFFAQAGPVIAQAAAQAIDSGLKGVDVRDFAKDAILPIALSVAKDTTHKALDAFLNTTIELNHQDELAPPDATRTLGSTEGG